MQPDERLANVADGSVSQEQFAPFTLLLALMRSPSAVPDQLISRGKSAVLDLRGKCLSIRVQELAKRCGLLDEQMIEQLRKLNYPVKSINSTVDRITAESLIRDWAGCLESQGITPPPPLVPTTRPGAKTNDRRHNLGRWCAWTLIGAGLLWIAAVTLFPVWQTVITPFDGRTIKRPAGRSFVLCQPTHALPDVYNSAYAASIVTEPNYKRVVVEASPAVWLILAGLGLRKLRPVGSRSA